MIPTSAAAPRVWLTLLLDGGQRESLSLDPAHPMLDALRSVLEGKAPPLMLEIPLREGAALLTVPSTRLIGVVTEPPLSLRLPAQTMAKTPAVAAVPGPIGVAAPGVAPGVVAARAAQIRNVLTAEQHAELLRLVEPRQKEFVSSTTSTGAVQYRDSTVLHQFAPFDELIRARLRQVLPKALELLGLPLFEVEGIEAQLTTHNDGNYYKVHNDNGNAETASRVLTFVYYFNRAPKAFTGGELRIYDRQFDKGYQFAAQTYKVIEPEDNSLVLFESREMHEVMPVSCPSQAFMDGRFTINGWVRRKP